MLRSSSLALVGFHDSRYMVLSADQLPFRGFGIIKGGQLIGDPMAPYLHKMRLPFLLFVKSIYPCYLLSHVFPSSVVTDANHLILLCKTNFSLYPLSPTKKSGVYPLEAPLRQM